MTDFIEQTRYVRLDEITSGRGRMGWLPLSASTWLRLVDEGVAPQPVRLGRSVFWSLEKIKEFHAQMENGAFAKPVKTGGRPKKVVEEASE